jgi:cytochrome c
MRMLASVLLALAAFAGQAVAEDAALLRRGQEVYGRCLGCHAIEQHRTGPAHCGLFGRRAGTAAGYAHYSPALRASGIVWDDRSLARFLADPMTTVPGTTMTYLGVTDAADRAALVAWLKQSTRPGACRPAG